MREIDLCVFDGAVDDDLLPDVGTVVFVELSPAAALGEDLGQMLAGLVGDGAVLQRAEVNQGALFLSSLKPFLLISSRYSS